MGYECPVCEVPQRDGEHLANHLAFTAMLREDDHEEWLDQHAPKWADDDPDDLAERVVEHAAEAEYDEVFEDTTDDHDRHEHGGQGHDHAHGHGGSVDPTATGRSNVTGRGYDGQADQETVDGVMAEARQLTAEMYGLDGDDESGETGGETADSDSTDAEE